VQLTPHYLCHTTLKLQTLKTEINFRETSEGEINLYTLNINIHRIPTKREKMDGTPPCLLSHIVTIVDLVRVYFEEVLKWLPLKQCACSSLKKFCAYESAGMHCTSFDERTALHRVAPR
jgi:hypothetical protein